MSFARNYNHLWLREFSNGGTSSSIDIPCLRASGKPYNPGVAEPHVVGYVYAGISISNFLLLPLIDVFTDRMNNSSGGGDCTASRILEVISTNPENLNARAIPEESFFHIPTLIFLVICSTTKHLFGFSLICAGIIFENSL